LGFTVYDTQCGAKFFKNTEIIRETLKTPFVTRWAFDVEILGRMSIGYPEVEKLVLGYFLEIPFVTGKTLMAPSFRFWTQ